MAPSHREDKAVSFGISRPLGALRYIKSGFGDGNPASDTRGRFSSFRTGCIDFGQSRILISS